MCGCQNKRPATRSPVTPSAFATQVYEEAQPRPEPEEIADQFALDVDGFRPDARAATLPRRGRFRVSVIC